MYSQFEVAKIATMPGICFGRLWPTVTISHELHMDFASAYTKIWMMILPGSSFFFVGFLHKS